MQPIKPDASHILNLVAKSILRSFDAEKKVAEGDVNNGMDVLAELAQELELKMIWLTGMTMMMKNSILQMMRMALVMGEMGCLRKRWMSWTTPLFLSS